MGKKLLIIAMGILLLYGCGSSDNGSSTVTDTSDTSDTTDTSNVTGLEMPANMSIVSANDGTPKSLSLGKAFDDAGTDYSTDTVNTYVYDASMEALGTVNMILCLISQTGATEMVNEGAYIAMVNEDECEQGENQSSSGETGQSSGGNAKQLNAWTLNVTRASSAAPQIVHAWVPDSGGGGGADGSGADPMDSQTILVEITQSSAPSDANPFGDFVMNFKGVVDGGLVGGTQGTEVETMRGTLQTVANADGLPQFRFINLGGEELGNSGFDFSFEEAVNVIFDDSEGAGGRAKAHRAESFSGPHGSESRSATFAIAFDADNMARGKDDNEDNNLDATQCLSRDDFNTNIWRYNLYHKNDATFNGSSVVEGQRVELVSGFPFTYGSDNKYGWVGYHGLWSEGGALDDGTTISKYDYATDTSEDCTINVSPGKMIRRMAESALLSGFQGDEFQYWGDHPTLNIFGEWIITVTENNGFAITSRFQWGEQGPEFSTTIDHDNNPNTAEVSVAANLSFNNGEQIWLWADALGGNIVYVQEDSVAVNDREVTFYGEEFINPGDSIFANGAVTLYCYDRCLKGGLTQTDVDNANSDQDLYYTYSGTPFQYTLSSAGGKVILTDSSNSEVVAVDLDLDSIGYSWGINTGEMITTPLSNPNEFWHIYDEEVSYRWETGSNDWNKQVTVTDTNGDVASFDAPLRFTYTHSTANDANDDASHNGDKFMLEYGGAGELWGFPWEEDNETGRWHAAITLADAAELSDGTNTFVVKGIEKEQTMQTVAASECSAFDLDAIMSNADIALPTASDISAVSFTLSGKPTVTNAPAVIEGVLQD